jgi:hypothetical protein
MTVGIVSDAINYERQYERQMEHNIFPHQTRYTVLQLLKFLYKFNIKGTLNGVNR